MHRLRELISRYRAEVRADLLKEYGVDLAQWWRDRRWVGLLELIDQLPAASRLNEAIHNDPEQATLIAEEIEARKEKGDDAARPWAPRLAEYDLKANLLRDMIQAIFQLRAAVIASANGKPGTIPNYPTPVTEVDRATARLERRWVDSLLGQFGFDPGDF